ncbi:sulfotransferase [Anaerohalosphaera lusitana]|uniref:sulfotransferase n=1 Tax=Anaerohalosphaera lusitana TaxID=1936003 RepID=UPI0014748133|nr:sulfotransferase [Anaerohalosphaera lusitana]
MILSLPRSGSSWVGEILGGAGDALYLREPLTQTYLRSGGEKKLSFFEFDGPPWEYEKAADLSFRAIPQFSKGIVRFPEQWGLNCRTRKKTVIKEVNPFVLPWLMQKYQPRIIYLVRHPASTAHSFHKMGWDGRNQFERRFLDRSLAEINDYQRWAGSFWSAHAAVQSVVLKRVLEQAKGYESFKLVQYENLCKDPINEFRSLYDFAGLKWDEAAEDLVVKKTQPSQVDKHSFSTQRNSAVEAEKWRKLVSADKLELIKEAWLWYDPPLYRDEW